MLLRRDLRVQCTVEDCPYQGGALAIWLKNDMKQVIVLMDLVFGVIDSLLS